MEKTTITLEENDIALVFIKDDIGLYYPKDYDTSKEPATTQIMIALAIANCLSSGHAGFIKVINEVILEIIEKIEEADGS